MKFNMWSVVESQMFIVRVKESEQDSKSQQEGERGGERGEDRKERRGDSEGQREGDRRRWGRGIEIDGGEGGKEREGGQREGGGRTEEQKDRETKGRGHCQCCDLTLQPQRHERGSLGLSGGCLVAPHHPPPQVCPPYIIWKVGMDFIIWGRESTHFWSADPCWFQRPSRPGPAAAKRLSGATKPSRAPLKTHYRLRSGA